MVERSTGLLPCGLDMVFSPMQWLAFATAAAAALWMLRRWMGRAAPDSDAALHEELKSELASLRDTLSCLAGDLKRLEQSTMALANPDRFVDVERDLQEVLRWSGELPPNDASYAALSAMDVDIKLIEMAAMQVRAGSLRLDYEADLAAIDNPDVVAHLTFAPQPLAPRKTA